MKTECHLFDTFYDSTCSSWVECLDGQLSSSSVRSVPNSSLFCSSSVKMVEAYKECEQARVSWRFSWGKSGHVCCGPSGSADDASLSYRSRGHTRNHWCHFSVRHLGSTFVDSTHASTFLF